MTGAFFLKVFLIKSQNWQDKCSNSRLIQALLRKKTKNAPDFGEHFLF